MRRPTGRILFAVFFHGSRGISSEQRRRSRHSRGRLGLEAEHEHEGRERGDRGQHHSRILIARGFLLVAVISGSRRFSFAWEPRRKKKPPEGTGGLLARPGRGAGGLMSALGLPPRTMRPASAERKRANCLKCNLKCSVAHADLSTVLSSTPLGTPPSLPRGLADAERKKPADLEPAGLPRLLAARILHHGWPGSISADKSSMRVSSWRHPCCTSAARSG